MKIRSAAAAERGLTGRVTAMWTNALRHGGARYRSGTVVGKTILNILS